jgi:peroxiredoxin
VATQTGTKAPPFELPCKPGETVNVGDHLGKEKIVLLFFPLAYSPVCTDEMCSMRDSWQQWEQLDAKVFGISVDSPFVVDKFRNDLNIPFPILSDFNKEVAPKYDALHEDLMGLKGVAKRAAFVIDANGEIVYDWISDDPKQMPDFDEIKAALNR